MSIVYLNNEYIPLQEAKISVLDRGFLFGDSIYEVIPVYNKNPFRLSQHLKRLTRSLNAIKLENPFTEAQWLQICTQIIARNPSDTDISLYIQVSRGVGPNRNHAFPIENITPTVLVLSQPFAAIPEIQLKQGIKAITVEDKRWENCYIKATTLLANVLARQSAVENNCHEAILVRNQMITEGSSSNIFIVDENNQVLTAPSNHLILEGITRNFIIELLQKLSISYQEVPVPEQTLKTAKEVWLTSSLKEILAITEINGQAVGNGKPGPVWKQVWDLFQQEKKH